MLYMIRVIETRAYGVEYTVEADSPEEAKELAEKGETVDEVPDRRYDCVARVLDGEPTETSADNFTGGTS